MKSFLGRLQTYGIVKANSQLTKEVLFTQFCFSKVKYDISN